MSSVVSESSNVTVLNGFSVSKNLADLKELLLKHAEKYKGMPIALSGGVDSSLLAALIKPKFAISVELPGDEKYNEIQYSKIVAEYLDILHVIVKVDDSKWDEHMPIAVKAIGRPIPHFNIFPLYVMYKHLSEMGVKDLVLGDGPDETMCGYARDIIIKYLYKIYDFEAFQNYKPLIDKLLPPLPKAISLVTGKDTLDTSISKVDIEMMRPDMDDMSNAIAKHFGITNHRPYQDNKEIDDFMLNLPDEYKINGEYGKYLLRVLAAQYLPEEIAWRKKKVGGPVYPVNVKRGWMENGEFDKTQYLNYQKTILGESTR